MRFRFVFAAIALACLASPAFAACTSDYVGGAEPHVTQAASASDVRELCFDAFAVGHSGVTHTALWSAEHLTAAGIDAARDVPRRDVFHAEAQLPRQERAELVDYVRSGFDRGHLTPSGDMPTPAAQAQSFTLANVVPQYAALNRGLWEEIEVATRDFAEQEGEIFVVTGPVFDSSDRTIHDRVRVPSALFKAIYDPRRRMAAAYLAPNVRGGAYRVISIAQLRDLIGVDVFPSLPEAVKQHAFTLAAPGRPNRQIASAGGYVGR
jgi:endonuclease G